MKARPILAVTLTSVSSFFDRGAYYGIRALLIMFMLDELKFEEQYAYSFYENFTLAVYIVPLFIAPLLDFVMPPKIGAMIGGVIMSLGAGLLVLGIPEVFVVAMGLVALGLSFSKLGNLTTLANSYTRRNNNRDIGFGVLYCGINLGSLVSTVVVSAVGLNMGFEYGFAIAALFGFLASATMLIGGWWLHPVSEDKISKAQYYAASTDVLDSPDGGT
ncbi:MAG: MFS transporter, partial [Flavobacteriales bacterium]|nr:MFS transporter [Flavobacteriales bacterium]